MASLQTTTFLTYLWLNVPSCEKVGFRDEYKSKYSNEKGQKLCVNYAINFEKRQDVAIDGAH